MLTRDMWLLVTNMLNVLRNGFIGIAPCYCLFVLAKKMGGLSPMTFQFKKVQFFSINFSLSANEAPLIYRLHDIHFLDSCSCSGE